MDYRLINARLEIRLLPSSACCQVVCGLERLCVMGRWIKKTGKEPLGYQAVTMHRLCDSEEITLFLEGSQ